MNDWCSRTVTSSGSGATLLMSRPGRSCVSNVGVARKGLRVRQEDRAAVAVERVASLLRAAQAIGDAVLVAEEKVGGVDEDGLALARFDFESPQHRLRERVLDAAPLALVVAQRAIALVQLHEEHLRAGAVEADEARLAHLAAIEADRRRPDAGRHAGDVDHLLAGPRDLHVELAGVGVPEERQE